MDYGKMREEALKNAVQQDYFKAYRYTQLGNIDFVIAKHVTENNTKSLFEDFENDGLKSILWAEAKQGSSHDIYESFVQLILTIGKERTFEKNLPPKYIGAFDAEKIAFIEYHKIQEVFYQNDFNWNVTPSNHGSKEFKQLHSLCENLLTENSIIFRFESQSPELKEFIRLNFKTAKDVSEKISVTKNNFTFVFQRWSESVKPTISVDWEKVKKVGIIAADFFLADLLSQDNESLKENLFVVLQKTRYEITRGMDEETGLFNKQPVNFSDRQKAYKEFWSIYARPPKEEYWDYIIGRRDLLVPQDIRERKGSFFTPQIWVEKSQEYLAEVLGETWQDEYYIWDCCAGTGNLLNGLTNYRNVWASTLDKQDVDVMKDRIQNGWSMFKNHVFQFDFLNDEFLPESGVRREEAGVSKKGKLPDELYEILCDEEKRKKLVIYINPPYAEAGTKRQISDTGKNKSGVSFENKIYEKWHDIIGTAAREVFAEFLIRIFSEINGCIIGNFSKLKPIQATNFKKFRKVFTAKLEKMFVVPSKTFDNVKGNFPIGFFIWNTDKKQTALFTANAVHEEERSPLGLSKSACSSTEMSLDISNPCGNYLSDVYDTNGNFVKQHHFFSYDGCKFLLDWIRQYYDKTGETIAYVRVNGQDMSNLQGLFLASELTPNDFRAHFYFNVTKKNILPMCIYLSVRLCIEPTWLNDRDQFLFPSDGWQEDFEFQGDCLVYTLFHGQNRISGGSSDSTLLTPNSSLLTSNHWIPFTEKQAGCKSSFRSTFMSGFIRDFLGGKVKIESSEMDEGLFAHDDGALRGVPAERVATDAVGAQGETSPSLTIHFSNEAKAVYDAGLELWRYYHAQKDAEPDASFYDIRRFFQGESKGRMNATSDDEKYMGLISDLREKQRGLAKKIELSVYKYGFLR